MNQRKLIKKKKKYIMLITILFLSKTAKEKLDQPTKRKAVILSEYDEMFCNVRLPFYGLGKSWF